MLTDLKPIDLSYPAAEMLVDLEAEMELLVERREVLEDLFRELDDDLRKTNETLKDAENSGYKNRMTYDQFMDTRHRRVILGLRRKHLKHIYQKLHDEICTLQKRINVIKVKERISSANSKRP